MVAFNNPAGNWILQHGRNCLLCQRTVDGLIQAIEQFVVDRPLRGRLAEAGIADIAASHGDWTRRWLDLRLSLRSTQWARLRRDSYGEEQRGTFRVDDGAPVDDGAAAVGLTPHADQHGGCAWLTLVVRYEYRTLNLFGAVGLISLLAHRRVRVPHAGEDRWPRGRDAPVAVPRDPTDYGRQPTVHVWAPPR